MIGEKQSTKLRFFGEVVEVLEFFEEATPKEARQHPYREEEPRLARHPPIGIGRETAGLITTSVRQRTDRVNPVVLQSCLHLRIATSLVKKKDRSR